MTGDFLSPESDQTRYGICPKYHLKGEERSPKSRFEQAGRVLEAENTALSLANRDGQRSTRARSHIPCLTTELLTAASTMWVNKTDS